MAHRRFPYGHLSKYPHMKPYDVAIWERFIRKHPNAFISCEYDVPVGDPRDNEEDLLPQYHIDRNILGKRKIDVVATTRANIFIIEVKPNAGAKALGQVTQYDFLYTRDYAPQKKTIAVIITDVASPNLKELCDEHNIELIEVGI